MSEIIEIRGIETNNLKNIDIALKKHSINLVIGPSGSGKSSLAYDTVAQIGQHEFTSMFADEVTEPAYKVRSYSNMIATVPIQQSNNNNNIRSTIGTYFGINQSVALIYSALLGLSEEFFVLNREENLCTQCRGLGFIREIDVNRIIDYDVPLEKCPIKCWIRNRDFYSQIIKEFCNDKGIDYKKNFRMLKESEKHVILFGESKEKYSVKYKKAGIYSRRTTKYYGIMTGTPMLTKFSIAKEYLADIVCTCCNGQKYSSEHNNYKLNKLSIGEFMCTPFSLLKNWIEAVCLDMNNSNLSFAVSIVSRFVQKTIELDLGHLFFHRAIPTLSGGELQRLRLVQVLNTQLSDLLIVLDEPLAGLSGTEKLSVFDNVLKLSERHTMLIVDHHDTFIKKAKVIIALGEKSGKNGGNIIDAKKYMNSLVPNEKLEPLKPSKIIPMKLDSPVYGYSGINLEIAQNCLNLIAGKSGVGKSTLLREYFPQYFAHYSYISQKSLVGKKNSSVATVLDIFSRITDGYAKKFGKEKQFFSKLTGCEGACPLCSGIGYIDYGTDYQIRTQIVCRECNGTGFNKSLKKYKIFDKSIFDVWSMTIDEASEFYRQVDNKVFKVLSNASDIMLGHLLIGQPTSTLSGGENIRIKILKSVNSSTNVYGIDEPFKGLSRVEIFNVIKFLNKLISEKKTIIVADHEEESFCFFTKRIRLVNQGGILVGIDYD